MKVFRCSRSEFTAHIKPLRRTLWTFPDQPRSSMWPKATCTGDLSRIEKRSVVRDSFSAMLPFTQDQEVRRDHEASGAAPTDGTPTFGPRRRSADVGGRQPRGTNCLPLTTLMSRFKVRRHECSSPDRFGSEASVHDRAWQGAAAEDDGRSHSDARVGYRRTLFRLGAASV